MPQFYDQPYLGSERLGILFESWVSCEGHWSESQLCKELRVSARHRRRGGRKWLTLPELITKYGSERIALRIKEAKESDPQLAKSQIRDNPDCPGVPDPSLF